MILCGTADGLYEISLGGDIVRQAWDGTEVLAISGDWAVVDGAIRSLGDDRTVQLPDGLVPRCVLSGAGGAAVIGTSAARLFEVDGSEAKPHVSFDELPSRIEWSTPWGGPPDTRSLALGKKGLLVNVHVGGVWRTEGNGWTEVVEPGMDAHQVVAVESTVAVASAQGIGLSTDAGSTWSWSTAGLHAPYCRAVTVAGDWLLASASDGPGTQRGAVYRRAVAKPEDPMEPCGGHGDLPRLFPYNVDTFELAAAGDLVALGTPSGQLYFSEDAGATWRLLTETLPGVRCVDFRT